MKLIAAALVLAAGPALALSIELGEGQAAQDVSPDLSLSRDAQHTDTDDNGSDFSGGDPTPGS